MSYYENQQWSSAASPTTWDHQTPPARSGTSSQEAENHRQENISIDQRLGASSAVPREDSTAFSTQLEEVDRAIDNLNKSGKLFNMPGRRESLPMAGGPPRSFEQQYDPRMGGGPPRHQSTHSDFGDARSFSGANLQNFYATQRHQPSRGANEAEQVMQAKRRMAAQRERELRNYHQEQQYNRSATADVSTFGSKSERAMSPAGSGMSEDDRRELIARQRNALYGEGANFSDAGFDEMGAPRPTTQSSGSQSATAMRGHSPLAFDNYKHAENPSQQAAEPQSAVTASGQPRSRANSTSSPSSNPPSSFSLFESAAQQSSRTSTSSPGGSPPRQGKAPTSSGVAPIGTRPAQAQNPALKRSTTPLPSPLSFGFAASSDEPESKDTRTPSAASNPNSMQQDVWGPKSAGPWGKNPLAAQASVWG